MRNRTDLFLVVSTVLVRSPALLLVLGLSFFLPAAVPGAERPNLVLIIADDMAWDDCGAYGHPTIRTPNIDGLARGGMRFDHAYLTASSCSPSRASIITGRYPHSTDAEQLHWPLPAEQVTFVEKLKAAGYFTAALGKWHLGDAMEERFDLVRMADVSGFQLPTGEAAAGAAMLARGHRASGCEDWVPVLRDRPVDRPFFLWLAALDPHRDYLPGIIETPHRPEDVRVPPHLPDVPEVRTDLALYYDEITRLDGYVGKVLSELERQGVAENTMVLFISDNGRPFPRDKTTLYDGGIKTPWIVRWPGRVKPGSTCGSLVSAVDIAPTFLELAGLPVGPTFQGKSFVPLLARPDATIRDHVFAEDHWHDYEDHARAVRSKRFKYIRNDYPDLPGTPPADAGRSLTYQAMRRLRDRNELTRAQLVCFLPRESEELYDTRADPGELNNLAGDPTYARALLEHREALRAWTRETGDTLPRHRTPDEFDRETGVPLPPRIRPRPSKREMQDITPESVSLKEEGRVAFTEGPAWHESGNVYFSDIQNDRIMRRDPEGQIHVFRTPAGRTNGLLFDREGRLLCCEGGGAGSNRRVTRTELNGVITVLAERYEGKRFNSPNDLAMDSSGRIYFSDPRYRSRRDLELFDRNGRSIEGVYRIDPDGTLTRIITHEVHRPNGILVSADDRYLFVAENVNDDQGNSRKVWRFELNPDGKITTESKKLLFDWGQDRGPDGMALDRLGRLHVAAGLNHPNLPMETAEKYRAGIYVIAPEGGLLGFIPVPIDMVTNCTFGDPDLKTLYITAGHKLWSIRVHIPGQERK